MDEHPEIPAQFAFLREWLASDDPVQRAHAEARIKLGFDRTIVAPEHKPASPSVVYLGAPPVQDVPVSAPILAGIPLAGDLVERAAKKMGADRFARWFAQKRGYADCNCAERRDRLNALDAKLRRYLKLG
jgi:hypothetical protein